MALNFIKEVNLTEINNNVEENLHIVNEPSNKIIQYYMSNFYQEDKSSQLTMADYDSLIWGSNEKRVTLREISNFGLKAFPKIGAIAYYNQNYENKAMILRPVHCARKYKAAPTVAVVTNDTTLTFNMSGVEYDCYRIIIGYTNGFTKEYITYTNTLTVPKPNMDEISEIYCIGYMGEAEEVSYESDRADLPTEESE